MGPDRTLVFMVCVQIDHEDGQFLSTLLPLSGTVIAAGKTADEAEANAITLFCNLVDTCIETGQLHQMIGESGVMAEVDTAIDQILEKFRTMNQRFRRIYGPDCAQEQDADPLLTPWLDVKLRETAEHAH